MLDISDLSFLIPVRIDSDDRLQNINLILKYLSKNFDCKILLMEIDIERKIDTQKIDNKIEYFFAYDSQPKLHRTKYLNKLTALAKTPYIALYDADVIFPVRQVFDAVSILRNGKYSAVSPYDGCFVNVDYLMKKAFVKVQDPDLFEANKSKLIISTKRSFGGAIFLNRLNYIFAGMENEYFTSWGPDDVERVKRMQILGYNITRVKGNLYHLPHKRFTNSFYQSLNDRINLMSIYLKICSLSKKQLLKHIAAWPWVLKTHN